MIVKKFVRILRGSATPAQIMLACVLGAALGFVPGFAQAPGLIAALVLSLVVLNANLTLALPMAAAAKVVSLLLMSVSFDLGRMLLDGPTQGLFKAAINAPVLALFGLEYYVTTGGLVLALVMVRLKIPPIPRGALGTPIQDIKEGLKFIKVNSIFSFLISMTFFNSVFGMAYVMLMPIFAVDILEVGAKGLGWIRIDEAGRSCVHRSL